MNWVSSVVEHLWCAAAFWPAGDKALRGEIGNCSGAAFPFSHISGKFSQTLQWGTGTTRLGTTMCRHKYPIGGFEPSEGQSEQAFRAVVIAGGCDVERRWPRQATEHSLRQKCTAVWCKWPSLV